MTARNSFMSPVLILAALVAGGCASDGSGLTTSAVMPEKMSNSSAAKIDPACATLASQIETLHKEGTVDRFEKAAAGKSDIVRVKRSAIAKQAELNKANADFQAKCGPQVPKAQTAQAAAPSAAQAVATQAATQKAATAAGSAPTAAAAVAAPASPDAAAKDAAQMAAKDADKSAVPKTP